MATWVGVFLSNIDGKSVRELEVEADNEQEAIIKLDLYDYDETWQDYLFVKIYKKRRSIVELLVARIKSILSRFWRGLLNIPLNHERQERTG
jgi:hypothetical protein